MCAALGLFGGLTELKTETQNNNWEVLNAFQQTESILLNTTQCEGDASV